MGPSLAKKQRAKLRKQRQKGWKKVAKRLESGTTISKEKMVSAKALYKVMKKKSQGDEKPDESSSDESSSDEGPSDISE